MAAGSTAESRAVRPGDQCNASLQAAGIAARRKRAVRQAGHFAEERKQSLRRTEVGARLTVQLVGTFSPHGSLTQHGQTSATIGCEATRPVRKNLTAEKLRNNEDPAVAERSDHRRHQPEPYRHFVRSLTYRILGSGEAEASGLQSRRDLVLPEVQMQAHEKPDLELVTRPAMKEGQA